MGTRNSFGGWPVVVGEGGLLSLIMMCSDIEPELIIEELWGASSTCWELDGNEEL